MWGTGASSTQCEGAAPASDWWDWERAGRAPTSGDGNGFATRYAEDFALLAGLGLTHHRLSMEWARLEPEPGVHDPAAVEHYRAVLAAARDAGVTPWVCLHHFTLPRWFAAEGGFLEVSGRTDAWARHVDFVAETFGDLVGGWQPVNEANYYARLCYDGGRFPPGHDDRQEVAVVDEAILLANAEAAVRLRQTGAPVASIFGLSAIVPQDNDDETLGYAGALRSILWEPGLGLFRDGMLRVRHREPVHRPDLQGAFDLIGFSYYSAMGVQAGPRSRSIRPTRRSRPSVTGSGPMASDWCSISCTPKCPTTALLVAEYGVGTDDDDLRAAYIERGLEVTHDAISRGIDVRGFFHWTAVDNYEWLLGYDVSFGLIDRDRNVRGSATVLQREALGRA